MTRIRRATTGDAGAWTEMRQRLWPDESDGHTRDVDAYFRGAAAMPLEVLVAVDDADRPIGFVELSIRSYAEGCESSRVAFLEGWYVEPDWRGRGVGAALVRAAEGWGRSQGCSEFGSDAEIANTASHAAHRALGFSEVARIVSFRKDL